MILSTLVSKKWTKNKLNVNYVLVYISSLEFSFETRVFRI